MSEQTHRVLRILIFALRQAGHGLGSIFFIPNPWIGLILWGALFSNLRFGLFALLGLVVGVFVKQLLRVSDVQKVGGGIKGNAFLAAILVAWLTGATSFGIWVQVLVAVFASAVAAVVAAVVAAGILSLFGGGRFPLLVTGYCLVASALFVICPQCTVLSANAMSPWPLLVDVVGWFEAFVRSMGAMVYSPSFFFGSLVCLAILLWSPTAFITGCVAWLGGLPFPWQFKPWATSTSFYPFPIISSFPVWRLGRPFFLPGRIGLLVALAGGMICAFFGFVLQVWLQGAASAYLPISLTLTIWLGIAALTLSGRDSVVKSYVSSRFPPEFAWARNAYLSQRFGKSDPLLAVPVVGALRISQGFSGKETHVGDWSHALDFQSAVLPEVDIGLDGHSIWGASVISPISGVVECIKNDVPDNVLGCRNFVDNWGNYVIIRLDHGGWVMLAHFMQGSIAVFHGMRTEVGTYLGRVGNSGRSSFPHLHLQFQNAPTAGAPTHPFRLANYLSTDNPDGPWLRWVSSDVPSVGEFVSIGQRNLLAYELLSTMMLGVATWFVEVKGSVPPAFRPSVSSTTFKIQVNMDETGRYRYDSGSGGWLLSRLDPDAWRVVELERVNNCFLKLLAVATPSIPYAATEGMVWRDVPPVLTSHVSYPLSFAPFFGKRFPVGTYQCAFLPQTGGVIEIVALEFDPRRPHLPKNVRCKLERFRGITRLEADFAQGSVAYTLLSFEPVS